MALTFVLTRLGSHCGTIHKPSLFLTSFLLFPFHAWKQDLGKATSHLRFSPGSCRCGIFVIQSSSMTWDPHTAPECPGLVLLGIQMGVRGPGILKGRCFVLRGMQEQHGHTAEP